MRILADSLNYTSYHGFMVNPENNIYELKFGQFLGLSEKSFEIMKFYTSALKSGWWNLER